METHRISEARLAPRSGALDVVIPAGASVAVIISLEREFFGIAAALAGELRCGRAPSQGLLESLAVAVAIHLAPDPDADAGRRRAARGLAPRKLEQVREFIEQRLAEGLLVEQLAAVVHMSPFHFARLFKLATGLSPHAYITARRVERAKELLRAGNLALIDVGAAVGFQTQGHFTEVFHRVTGITPRRFRLAHADRAAGRDEASA